MQHEPLIQKESQRAFGRYRVLKRIGRGGMGEVWLCEDSLIHRQVAVKTLPPHSQGDQEYVFRFEREAQAAAALNHPHILPVHDYGREALADEQLLTYLVMPYIDGGSLADLIQELASRQQGMEQDLALLLLDQMADALDYAHGQGMVHRDVKPANMLLRSKDWLLLTDFGVVHMVSDRHDRTEEGMIIGTPIYMSPEQAQGRAEAASDLYSLAVIAYQLIVGRPPFNAESSYATIMQHVLFPPPPPRQLHAKLPARCEEVLLRGLAKHPAERYASGRTFVDELKRSLGVALPEPAVAVAQSRPHLTRRNVLIGTGVGLLAMGAGASFWAYAANKNVQQTRKAASQVEKPAMVLREHLGPATILAWVPNKNVLTSSCDTDSTVKLWDIDAFRYRQQPEYASTQSVKIAGANLHIAWSRDGKYLAIANSHSSDTSYTRSFIDLWEADIKTPVKGFEQGISVPDISVVGMDWLENRFPVAIWDDYNSKEDIFYLGMWDVTQPALKPQPLAVKGILSTTDFRFVEQALPVSPDGKQIAIATTKRIFTGTTEIEDNKVVWRPDSLLLPFPTNHFLVNTNLLVWGMGGRRLLAVLNLDGSDTVVVWDLAKKEKGLLRFGIPADATHFTVFTTHPRSTSAMFAGGTEDGKIYIWSGEAMKLPIRTLFAPTMPKKVIALSWSPDGQWLAASYDDENATILIWKI